MLIGLVGGPNKGKSTLFNALTHGNAMVANYPFTTIDPNKGVAFVRVKCACKELGVTCSPRYGSCTDGIRSVPINVIDVAGLVPGAHEGKGRGNEFLNDLTNANALICLVDASGMTDEHGNPAPQGYDVSTDARFVLDELDHWLAKVLTRNSQRIGRAKSLGEVAQLFSGIGVNELQLRQAITKSGVALEPAKWHGEDFISLARAIRAFSKPVAIAANKMDLPKSQENLETLKEAELGLPIIPVCADLEYAIQKAKEKGFVTYDGEKLGMAQGANANPAIAAALGKLNDTFNRVGTTGVDSLLSTVVFELLNLTVVFPVEDERKYCDNLGRVLPDALLLRKGSTPIDVAGAIHSDLAKGFLYAVDARTKMRLAKDDVLNDRQVVKIVSTG